GLARDIQRYLSDEPVEACPPSATYRLRKFAKKNRAALTTAATIAFLLVAGTGVSAWQALRGTRAEAAAGENREQAETAEKAAKQERDAKAAALEAETKARQQAFAALRSMTDEVVEKKFAQGAALTEDDRKFLRGVIAQYDAFAKIKGEDADSQAVRAEG